MNNEIENNDQFEEIEYKIILLGDTSVGKTCLFRKITTGIFMDKNIATVGIDRRTLKINCDFEENGEKVTKTVILNLTDTSGQERFKSLSKSYYKGSDAALLLYDITDKKSFTHLEDWMESVRNSATNSNQNKYCIFLMGTKIDLIESGKRNREVTIEEAKDKCEKYSLEWGGECSNKEFSEEKYKDIFKGFMQILYKKIGYKKFISQSFVNLNSTNIEKKSGCPCIIF